MKSDKNKTIDLSEEQVRKYLALCRKRYEGFDSVIHGDCIEIAGQIPPKSVDLLIADPPYNMNKTFGRDKFSKTTREKYALYTEEWIKAILPTLKEDASVYVCCDWYSGMTIGEVLSEFFTIRNRITWQREKGRGASDNWKSGMEDVWYATLSDKFKFRLDRVKQRKKVIAPYRQNGQPKDWSEDENGKFRYTCPSNFWDDCTVPYWSMSENTVHPTQKPEKLLAKIILASSDEGDVVFDPFGGSGSTAVTAKKLGRRFLTVERDEKFCATAAFRLERAERDKRIQGYEDGEFLPRNQC